MYLKFTTRTDHYFCFLWFPSVMLQTGMFLGFTKEQNLQFISSELVFKQAWRLGNSRRARVSWAGEFSVLLQRLPALYGEGKKTGSLHNKFKIRESKNHDYQAGGGGRGASLKRIKQVSPPLLAQCWRRWRHLPSLSPCLDVHWPHVATKPLKCG